MRKHCRRFQPCCDMQAVVFLGLGGDEIDYYAVALNRGVLT
jgi:hypothetical protein